MIPLRPRADLLTSEEHIIGVGVEAIGRVRHGIEGPDSTRVLVQDEEVGVILLLD